MFAPPAGISDEMHFVIRFAAMDFEQGATPHPQGRRRGGDGQEEASP